MATLPRNIIDEIEAACDSTTIIVPRKFDDLAPLVVRHRELSERSDLDEEEKTELASLGDLLEVARRDGWHTSPKGNGTPDALTN
jgi:hypothetical protein